MPAGKLLKKEMESFKEALIERRNMLVGDEASVKHSSMSDHHSDTRLPDDSADKSAEAYDIDFAFSRMESAEEEIKLIDEALQRIVTKEYGTCVECDSTIPKKRLKALPYAKRCVPCKERFEINGELVED